MLKMQIIGHLGKDAEINDVNGKTVINFNVAHTEKYNGNEKTTWVQCAYWTDKTGIAPYLKKGTQVYAEGTPEVRTYQKQSGETVATMNLRVFSVQLLGGGQRNDAQQAASPVSQAAPAPAGGFSDDLPF